MKITLNSSVPQALRPRAEGLVRAVIPDAGVTWAASRFPRLVVMVSPEEVSMTKARAGSMFEDAAAGTAMSPGTLADILEQRLRPLLEEK